VHTTEVRIDSRHQFYGHQQAGGFDYGLFPMDPGGLQGIEPWASDGQRKGHKSDALSFLFDALVVLVELLPHGLDARPSLSVE
jgi:hypothetical protein